MKKFLTSILMVFCLSGCAIVVVNDPDNNRVSQSNQQVQTLTDSIDNLNNILERIINKINRYY